MIINIEDFKIKKMNRTMVEMSETIKQGGMLLGDACYILAYKAREYAARMEANEKELNKLKT
ncbi:hypothetical protein AB0Y20_01155 [Heyndrickxia oleronia]|uniref:hypothetical protein n=1 Tax=Heyndrickxia oleronia TaxID=38875 RepID=UPI003F238C6A